MREDTNQKPTNRKESRLGRALLPLHIDDDNFQKRALDNAAKALAALWKISGPERPKLPGRAMFPTGRLLDPPNLAGSNNATDSSRLLTLIALVVVIVGLYFGRQVLIPLALAVVLTFLFTPVVEPAGKMANWAGCPQYWLYCYSHSLYWAC